LPFLLFGAWSVFLFLVLGFFIYSTWKATETTANETSANEARILANSLDSALRRIEAIMDWTEVAVRRIESGGSLIDEAITSQLVSLTRNFQEITGITYYSPDGSKRASSSTLACIMNEDSKALVFTNSHTSLEYSATLDCDETGKHILVAHRALYGEGEKPLGYIAGSVDLSFYEALFSRIKVGQNGMVSFRRADTSRLVVRWPIITEQINNLAPGIPPQLAISEGAKEGVIQYRGGTDGIERIFAFQRIEGYPFYALVGREVGDVFDSWLLNSVIAVLVTLLLLFTSGIFLIQLDKNLNLKNRLIHELLHRTNNSLQLVLSLVQLSLFQFESPNQNSKTLLEVFYSRVRTLSLAQKCITRDFSSVIFRDLIVALAQETGQEVRVNLEPPQYSLLLDFAVPLGLVLNELFENSPDKSQVDVEITQITNKLVMGYRVNGLLKLSSDTENLVRTLIAHQLSGNFAILALDPFECTVDFPLDLYSNRIHV